MKEGGRVVAFELALVFGHKPRTIFDRESIDHQRSRRALRDFINAICPFCQGACHIAKIR